MEELSGEVVVCLAAQGGEAGVQQQLLNFYFNPSMFSSVTWELPRSEETLVLLLRLDESGESRGDDCERGR